MFSIFILLKNTNRPTYTGHSPTTQLCVSACIKAVGSLMMARNQTVCILAAFSSSAPAILPASCCRIPAIATNHNFILVLSHSRVCVRVWRVLFYQSNATDCNHQLKAMRVVGAFIKTRGTPRYTYHKVANQGRRCLYVAFTELAGRDRTHTRHGD